MKENHSLALIIAYYLSKFDRRAYESLGISKSTEGHKEIGGILGVNPNSVKNMRDEFDPLHDNDRVGWYQRPLRPSRLKVVESFQHLTEEELRDIVIEIMKNPDFSVSDDFTDIVQPISRRKKKRKGKSVFILRGPTGRKAEEFFIDYFKEHKKPVPGKMIDMRDRGCGYDFEILYGNQVYQIEVKGLDGDSGGIIFTSKEWDTALQKLTTYYLVVVRNISSKPEMQFIKNPTNVFSPKKNIFTTVQVQWNITASDLARLK